MRYRSAATQKLWNVGEILAIFCYVLLTAGCRSEPDERFSERLEIENLWLKHQAAVVRAIDDFNRGNEFEEARSFFLKVTDIEIGVDTLSSGDVIPGSGALEDLERIRAWYMENNDRLYLEPGTATVRLRLLTAEHQDSVTLVYGEPARREFRRRQAQEIWKAQEEVVVRALDGSQRDNEFEEAVRFFAELTGVEIDVHIYTMGFLPGPEAGKDLQRIREWYAKKNEDLFFDEDTLSVRVASSFTSSAPTAAPLASDQLRVSGVTLGFTEEQVVAAWGEPRSRATGVDEMTGQSSLTLEYQDATAHFLDGGLSSFECRGAGCRTPDGVSVGDPRSKVLRVYGDGQGSEEADHLTYGATFCDCNLTFEIRGDRVAAIVTWEDNT